MRYNVETDSGSIISGWVAPENPMAIPRIIIDVDGREPIEMEAVDLRQDIIDAGLHATGRVGFRIDATLVPDIATAESVEIFESESRICVYRRLIKNKHIEKKIFIFDSSIMPQTKLINNINSFFAVRHNFIERHGYETILTIVHTYLSKSIFLSGRPNLARYSESLRSMEFSLAAMLRNPFEELAERLLFLKLVGKSRSSALLTNFMTGLEPAIELARDLPLDDRRALNAAFRRLTPPQRLALSNPMTRMLACNLDERVERRHVSTALDNLSQMELVGVRGKFVEFSQILNDLMGVDVTRGAEPETFQDTASLSETLSRVGSVTDLLEHDLALYSFTEEAVEVGLGDREAF